MSTPRTIILAVLTLGLTLPAASEPSLTEYNGTWTGHGRDRDMPFQALQDARCRAHVKNDATHMISEIACNGAGGLRKRIQIRVALDGNRFTGTAEQTSSTTGRAPTKRAGKVTGERDGNLTNLTVRFPGLTPNAYVVLERTAPETFSMKVTTLGATLTDVEFRRR